MRHCQDTLLKSLLAACVHAISIAVFLPLTLINPADATAGDRGGSRMVYDLTS